MCVCVLGMGGFRVDRRDKESLREVLGVMQMSVWVVRCVCVVQGTG